MFHTFIMDGIVHIPPDTKFDVTKVLMEARFFFVITSFFVLFAHAKFIYIILKNLIRKKASLAF